MITRLVVSIFLSMWAAAAFGQTLTTGTIVGIVTDTSGAVVKDAAVTLDHAATGDHRETVTNEAGQYRFPLLKPGQYTVSAKSPGLRSAVQSIDLLVGQQQAIIWMLPDKTGEALEQLIEAIRGAKKSIHIAMFTLTHPRLVDALIEAFRRGVAVKCALDYYTGQGASLKEGTRLHDAGIPLYMSLGQQLLHHKWADIDHEMLILGSANWTRAAFAHNMDCFMMLHPLNVQEKKKLCMVWKTIKRESKKWTP